MTTDGSSANGISSVLGRRLTIALGIVVGLILIVVGVIVLLLLMMSGGGGDRTRPVFVFAGVAIALGFGTMLRTGWWADRSR